MTTKIFAGINTRPIVEALEGQDVLISYADIQKGPSLWTKILKPALERGHFASAVLDSGAFTELSQRAKGREFKIKLEDYAAFAAENQHLFSWVCNLDDIAGSPQVSNSNLAYLKAQGVNAVPVYHEGETDAQLRYCLVEARKGPGILAVGCQRPLGKLRPTAARKFLAAFWTRLARFGNHGVKLHGFGLTRFAAGFDSVDSTTWNAEFQALKVAAKGPHGVAGRLADLFGGLTRVERMKVAVASYFAGPAAPVVSDCPVVEDEARGQARTVCRRFGSFAAVAAAVAGVV